MTDAPARGALVLVATPIGNLADLAPRARTCLEEADLVCCEDTRHTGKLLAASGIRAQQLLSLHAHNEAARIPSLLARLDAGETVALVSDAGTPLVSDPGERLVAAAIAAGATVTAIPGPSALLAALVVSGFPTTPFVFVGFLPRKGGERTAVLAEIAVRRATTILYEAPTRLGETLGDLLAHCGPTRRVAVARELTKLHEETWRATLLEAVTRVAMSEARGEHVVVVEPAPPPPPVEDAELVAATDKLRGAGLSRRDIAAVLEALFGLAHREAYDRAVTGSSS